MTQYIDKSALVAELESLRCTTFTNFDEGVNATVQILLETLDTLEVKEVQEEPVSEDLEEAVNAYIGYAPEVDESSSVYGKRQAFKAGAEWQKEKKDQETIELAEDHAMFAGIIKGTEHTIGNVRSILNKVAYKNNGLDVNGDYYEQPYVELDNEFRELLKED